MGSFVFLMGILGVTLLPSLPKLAFLVILVVCVLILFSFGRRQRFCYLGAIALSGFIWAAVHAHYQQQQQLPQAWQGHKLVVTGRIEGLPQRYSDHSRFVFVSENFLHKQHFYHWHRRLQLNWYGRQLDLQPGQTWVLVVKLKTPHGLANPGSFAYEKYLFQQRIHATGYVLENRPHYLLATHTPLWQTLRLRIAKQLQTHVSDAGVRGLLQALLIAERSGVLPAHWQVLRHTGTTHLLAISGLHIGLVAGFVYWLVARVWRLLCYRASVLACQVGAVAAMLAAIVYSALAGFTLPTQRALIMLLVYLGAQLLQRQLRPGHALRVALIMVLLVDPLAVLAIGFWLSFAAVACLTFVSCTYYQNAQAWQRSLRAQLTISLGLLPLTLYFFGQVPLVSCLINLLAIPYVGLLVLPCALFSTLLLLCGFSLASDGLQLSAWLLQWFLTGLTSVSHVPLYVHSINNMLYLLLALVGVAVLLSAIGAIPRYLGVLYLLPALLAKPPAIAHGDLQVSILDVGQGLACVLQTQQHTLVFDTGPPYGKSSDAGQRVLIPFLRWQGVDHIDTLVISHGDSDHSGGAKSLVHAIPVRRVLTSELTRFQDWGAKTCLQGQHWRWDGVQFEFLYPSSAHLGLGNNSSCVLKVTSHGQSVLLTGDIERRAERYLLKQQQSQLRAKLLVAPHHGSKSSSGLAFVRAVAPEAVIFASGYHNRFGFPRQQIVQRYQQQGAQIFNTADSGALSITLRAAPTLEIQAYRRKNAHFWLAKP